jgi:hypothetical protein
MKAQRIKHAISESDLLADTNAADLARYVATVIHVQAATGASRAELRRVIQTAMRAWPD